MPRIYSEFRIPFRQASDENPQTTSSIVLRTIGIALGIIGAAIGIYLLINSRLFASATIVGTVAVILSSPLLFLALFRRQYIAKEDISIIGERNTNTVVVDDHQDLTVITNSPLFIKENNEDLLLPKILPVNTQEVSPQVDQFNIETLQSVLIGEIFSYLGLQELGRGCSVSKTMQKKLKNERNENV